MRERTLLFVCEYNACRSQLGEAVARSIVPRDWRVFSAGLRATGVAPEVVRALRESLIDCASQTSKSLGDVTALPIDDVFVLAAPAIAPVRAAFPRARIWEWPMDDPLRAPGGAARAEAAVRDTRNELRRRLTAWMLGESGAI